MTLYFIDHFVINPEGLYMYVSTFNKVNSFSEKCVFVCVVSRFMFYNNTKISIY